MLFGQTHTQSAFGDRRQTEFLPAEEPCGQLGVEQRRRAHAALLQAGKILSHRMDDPLVGAERGIEIAEVSEGLGIEEERACTLATQLDEERSLPISDARGPFGIDGDRPIGGSQAGDRGGESVRGVDNVGDAIRGCFQKR